MALINLTLAKERYSVCKSCEEFIKVTKFCNQCKCFMPAKTVWSYSECPMKKWNKAPADPSVNVYYQVEDTE